MQLMRESAIYLLANDYLVIYKVSKIALTMNPIYAYLN